MGAPAAHEVVLWGEIGRIWNSRPDCMPDGLISVVQHPKHPLNAFNKCLFTCAAFSRKAEHFASVDNRGNVFVFYIKRNRFKLLARGGFAGTSIAFSSCCRSELYVGFADHSVQCYHPDTGQLLFTLRGHASPVTGLSMHASGDVLSTCSPDGVVLWDLQGVNRKKSLGAGPYGCVEAQYSPRGDGIVTAYKDDTFWFWDAETFALQRKLKAPEAGPARLVVSGFSISPDGKSMAAVGRCPLLYVWDLVAFQLVCCIHLPPPTSAASQVHFLPDSRVVAVGADHGHVYFVDILDATLEYTVAPPAPPPRARCDMPGHPELGNSGSTVSPSGHVSPCSRFEVDSSGNYALAVTRAGTARLYDLAVLRAASRGKERPLLRTEAADLPSLRGPAAMAQGPGEDMATPLLDPSYCASGMQVASSITKAVFGLPQRGRRGWTDTSACGGGGGRGLSAPGLTKRDQEPTRAPSTFQLLNLDPESSEVNRERLRELLHAYGEYPGKYRLLIWRFLLGVPHNVQAHRALVGRGAHPAYVDLAQRYPIQSRTLFSRLSKVLHALAHWCPAFGAAPYVAGLAFPFVKLMGADDVATFEVVASVLLNWCRGWFEMFPHPPLHVLGGVEALLTHHDPALQKAIAMVGGRTAVQLHLWALMQTLLTEVLSRDEWLKVWDHVLTNEPGGGFLHFVVVAYLVHFRATLLRATSEAELRAFFRRPNAVDVNALIKTAYRLRQDTSSDMQPTPAPLERLPPGPSYPLFDGYPKVDLDWHIHERERLRADEEMLLRRRHQVLEMAARTDSLAKQEAAWRDEKERLAALEAARRAQARAEETRLVEEQAALDELAKQETLRQVGVVEATYRAALQRQRAAWCAELEQLRADAEAKQQRLAQDVRSRLQEEQLRTLEFQSQQQLWQVEEEHLHAASVQRLRDEVKSRAAADELELRRKQHEWKAEDEVSRLRREQEGQRRARTVVLEEEAAARDEAGRMLVERAIDKEARVAEVERERRVRMLAEEEALRASEMMEAERQRDKIRALEEQRALAASATANKEWLDGQVSRREEAVESMREDRAVESVQRSWRLKELERAEKRRAVEAALAKERAEYEAMNAAEERETRRVLLALEDERRKDLELELQLHLKEEELRQKQDHLSNVATGEVRAQMDERNRFQQLREELRRRWALEESEHRLKHEEVMARLALEREQQLIQLDTLWRKRAGVEEATAINKERREYEVARQEREERYRTEERALLREVHDLHGEREVDEAVARAGASGGLSTEPSTETASASPYDSEDGGPGGMGAVAAATIRAAAAVSTAERAASLSAAEGSESSFVPSESAVGMLSQSSRGTSAAAPAAAAAAAAAAATRGGGGAVGARSPEGSATGSSGGSDGGEGGDLSRDAAAAAASASASVRRTTTTTTTASAPYLHRTSMGVGRREAEAWAAERQGGARSASEGRQQAGGSNTSEPTPLASARGGAGAGAGGWHSAVSTESGGDGGFTSGSAASPTTGTSEALGSGLLWESGLDLDVTLSPAAVVGPGSLAAASEVSSATREAERLIMRHRQRMAAFSDSD